MIRFGWPALLTELERDRRRPSALEFRTPDEARFLRNIVANFDYYSKENEMQKKYKSLVCYFLNLKSDLQKMQMNILVRSLC